MSLSDKIIWIVAALLVIPILATPAGWAAGAALIGGWLLATYAIRYWLDLEKHRREGERGMAHDVRSRASRRDK